MNKANFVKRMEALIKANNTWEAIMEAIGGDFENDLTDLLDVIPKMYAEFYNIQGEEELDIYLDCLWGLVRGEEYHWGDTIHLTNWEEFYDYFFVK